MMIRAINSQKLKQGEVVPLPPACAFQKRVVAFLYTRHTIRYKKNDRSLCLYYKELQSRT